MCSCNYHGLDLKCNRLLSNLLYLPGASWFFKHKLTVKYVISYDKLSSGCLHLFSKVVYFYTDEERMATEPPHDYFNPSAAPAHRSIFPAPGPSFSGELWFN